MKITLDATVYVSGLDDSEEDYKKARELFGFRFRGGVIAQNLVDFEQLSAKQENFCYAKILWL